MLASGIAYREGIVPNRYVGRTFIKPTQHERQSAVRLKLNVIREIVAGKKLVVVDSGVLTDGFDGGRCFTGDAGAGFGIGVACTSESWSWSGARLRRMPGLIRFGSWSGCAPRQSVTPTLAWNIDSISAPVAGRCCSRLIISLSVSFGRTT